MYLTPEIISVALDKLKPFHPFFGLTFLVFKKGNLPVGKPAEFAINKLEKDFLEKHYKPLLNFNEYYRVMRANQPRKAWNKPDYPSSGSQSTRTKGPFADAFIHQSGTNLWGWKKDYITKLKELLPGTEPIPAFYLAVWLYREKNWPEGTNCLSLVEEFASEFRLKRFEVVLFNRDVPSSLDESAVFQDSALTDQDLLGIIERPTDMVENEAADIDPEDVLQLVRGRIFFSEQHSRLTAEQLMKVTPMLDFNLDEDDKVRAINGVLHAMKTGCDWNDIPEEYGSPTMCKDVLETLKETGMWAYAWRNLLGQFNAEEKLSWVYAFLEGKIVPTRE